MEISRLIVSAPALSNIRVPTLDESVRFISVVLLYFGIGWQGNWGQSLSLLDDLSQKLFQQRLNSEGNRFLVACEVSHWH